MKNIMVPLCNKASHVFDFFLRFSFIFFSFALFSPRYACAALIFSPSIPSKYIICTLKCSRYERNLQITFIHVRDSNYIRSNIALVGFNLTDTLLHVRDMISSTPKSIRFTSDQSLVQRVFSKRNPIAYKFFTRHNTPSIPRKDKTQTG